MDVDYGNTSEKFGVHVVDSRKESWDAFDSFPKHIRVALAEAPREYSPVDLQRVLQEIREYNNTQFFRQDDNWVWSELLRVIQGQIFEDRLEYDRYIRKQVVILPGDPKSIVDKYFGTV